MTATASAHQKPAPFWPSQARLTLGGTTPGPLGPLAPQNVADALSERASRRVLAACVDAALSVKGISAAAGIPLATTYRQVHRLMALGVLVIERSAMTRDGKKYDLYRSRIKEAHIDLADGQEAVRFEPNEAIESRLIEMWDALRMQARE